MAGVDGFDVFEDDVVVTLRSTSSKVGRIGFGGTGVEPVFVGKFVPAIDEQSNRLTKPSAEK